jgi:hypothetical protein
MDPVLVMFGCLLCTMSGLIFIEVRRIRKKMDRPASQAEPINKAA